MINFAPRTTAPTPPVPMTSLTTTTASSTAEQAESDLDWKTKTIWIVVVLAFGITVGYAYQRWSKNPEYQRIKRERNLRSPVPFLGMLLHFLLNIFAEYRNLFTNTFDEGQWFLKCSLILLDVVGIAYFWSKDDPFTTLRTFWCWLRSQPLPEVEADPVVAPRMVTDVLDFHYKQRNRTPLPHLVANRLPQSWDSLDKFCSSGTHAHAPCVRLTVTGPLHAPTNGVDLPMASMKALVWSELTEAMDSKQRLRRVQEELAERLNNSFAGSGNTFTAELVIYCTHPHCKYS